MRRAFPLISIFAIAILLGGAARADEGMWMLHQISELDQAQLKQMGLQLTPEQIWDFETNSGLASAICSLGGCSASFVSPEGLIITNHHCAFRALQSNATPEHDLITDGYLAHSRAEELPARGYHVYVFKGYDDVTREMASALDPKLAPAARQRAIERREKELVATCEKGGLHCRVAEMFGGLKFYLFRTLELRDVRLVYSPALGIGDYGGEVDNWIWPRHTGDFSFLRAYVAPDGAPADYSPNNVPYRPERWLKIAMDPLKAGDFTMIMGYPGRTMRYRIASWVAEDADFYYPQRIAILKDLIAIDEAQAKRGKDVEIKLATALKFMYNSYKNNQGMEAGLRKSDLAARKKATEDALAAWIAADPDRVSRFGDVLPKMNALVAGRQATRDRDFLLYWLPMVRSNSLLGAAVTIERWTAERAKPDLERRMGYQERDERMLRQRLEHMQRDLDVASDRAMLRYLLQRAAKLPAGERIAAVDSALAASGKSGDAAIDTLLDRLYDGTKLADRDARMEMFGLSHQALLARHDPMIDFAAALHTDREAMREATERFEGSMVELEPRFIEALAAWKKAPLYPDANGTLRFTYATVKGYSPRDAVVYLPFTTLHGVLEKNTGVPPFDCPPRLLEAAKKDHFDRYVDPQLHDVPSCFTSTNDITGGNSGSPIMNGKGELVGLAFDGDYESMTSDYQFDPALSRTINVDIRYVLWIMDYVDGAHDLMREMGVQPQQP
jgi:Peptidase S46